jgi:hypothetical protein
MQDQVSMEAVAKRWPVVLPALLEQAHSDVQRCCHVATASSSCVKAQDAYDELNSMWTFPDELKNSSSTTLPFGLSCRSFFFLGDDGDFQVANCRYSCGSYRKHQISSPVMIQLTNIPSLSALSVRSPQMLIQLSCWSCVRTRGTQCWVTQDTFRSSDKILW